jgi:anti-sigma regulatory factor (Ser/Thr protein kinase)
MARHAAEEQLGLLPAHGPHDALLYDSPKHLAAVAVPFLRNGLARGDVVVLAAGGPAVRLLHEAVDGDSRVIVLDRGDLYRPRTPAALTTYRGLGNRRPPGSDALVRVIGEVDFGPTRRHWPEWQRFEAVMNHQLPGGSVWGLCIFDTQRLPQALLDTALQTHPHVATATGRTPNPRFTDPASYLRSLPVPVEPLEASQPSLSIADVRDVAGLRHSVADQLARLPGQDLAGDFLLAMDEMTSNAIRHGGPPVSLRLWIGADRIVGSIGDGGPGWDDPFAGYGPAHGDDLSRGGMGLWLARQLCDHVDVVSDGRNGSGVRIRLTTYLT